MYQRSVHKVNESSKRRIMNLIIITKETLGITKFCICFSGCENILYIHNMQNWNLKHYLAERLSLDNKCEIDIVLSRLIYHLDFNTNLCFSFDFGQTPNYSSSTCPYISILQWSDALFRLEISE